MSEESERDFFWQGHEAGAKMEREICAKIAEAYTDRWDEPDSAARAIRKLAASEIAALIRARSRSPSKQGEEK